MFGISLIYGLTGTLALTEIFDFIKNIQTDTASLDLYNVGLIFSLTFILVSLAFKFGAAPFHMWIPAIWPQPSQEWISMQRMRVWCQELPVSSHRGVKKTM